MGIVLDGRGRPLELPLDDPAERIRMLTEWIEALDAYPQDCIARLQSQRPVGETAPQGGTKRGGLFGFLK